MARGSMHVRVRPPVSSAVRLVFFFWRAAGMSLADLSASLLDLLGTLWRATEVGARVEKIDR